MRALPRVRAERESYQRLLPQLRPCLSLARLAHSLAERALTLRAKSRLNPAEAVQARLLVQAANQFRAVELAAVRGYALQALGATSTLYEQVSAIGYVDSHEKADAWHAHTDFKESYPPPKKRPTGIRFMLLRSGVQPADVEPLVRSWEGHHQRFCAAKHGNPRLLDRYAVTQSANELTLHLGPITGSAYLLFTKIALYHGARLLADASVLFATPMITTSTARSFRRARRDFLNKLARVAATPALAQFDP